MSHMALSQVSGRREKLPGCNIDRLHEISSPKRSWFRTGTSATTSRFYLWSPICLGSCGTDLPGFGPSLHREMSQGFPHTQCVSCGLSQGLCCCWRFPGLCSNSPVLKQAFFKLAAWSHASCVPGGDNCIRYSREITASDIMGRMSTGFACT